MGIHYFAPGSNMSRKELRSHGLRPRMLGVATLDGHRVVFSRRSVRTGTGVADVVLSPDEKVWGVLYELEESDLDALDRKEGQGWAYARRPLSVRLCADETLYDAIAYTVIQREPAEVPPSRSYLTRLIRASGAVGLPLAYRESIASHVADLRAGPAPASRSEREFVYRENIRVLERQSVILSELRTRANMLLAANGVVAAVFGASSLLARHRPHPVALGVVAIAAFTLSEVLCVAVLWSVRDEGRLVDPLCWPTVLDRLRRRRPGHHSRGGGG